MAERFALCEHREDDASQLVRCGTDRDARGLTLAPFSVVHLGDGRLSLTSRADRHRLRDGPSQVARSGLRD